MDMLYARCAGLDVHRDTVVACVRLQTDGPASNEVRTFGTKTGELLELSAWLSDREVTHVAMEATGVYWRPVWHILDGDFELVLANAAHVKNVPGRKTDVNDSTWLAGPGTKIPGIGEVAAAAILSEVGVDMGRFPTAGAPRLVGHAVPS